MRAVGLAALLGMTSGLSTGALAALPSPATGGKGGGPINVLFVMSGGGAGSMTIDSNVLAQLKGKGYVVQQVNDREPLTTDFLRQFNTLVLVGLDDYHGGRYYGPGGIHLLNTAANVKLIQQYVSDGGGLVVVPLMSEAGSAVASTYADALAPWQMGIGWETVRDDANPVSDWQDSGKRIDYSWTRAITRGPLTEGVQSLVYPNCVMRWDDAYPTVPLLLRDPAWQVLARGDAGSRGMRRGDQNKWVDGEAGSGPALAAAREAGKGRVAVVGLGAYHLIAYAFAEKDAKGGRFSSVGENTTGPMEGISWSRGDGKTSSDWGVLFDNLLRWTGEAGARAGFGGTPVPWVSKLQSVELPASSIPGFAVVDWKTQALPPTWAHHSPTPVWWRGTAFYDEIPDPLLKGPQQMNKVLIGARSSYSDGKGSVADWAKAARAAGFKAIVFTEKFEAFKAANWSKFMQECAANSSPDFACLQGIDIADTYGNRFLILGTITFPNAGMLSADGKALEQTSRLSLGFSGHIAVLHRLAGNKTLPTELCRHFQGVSVYTYGYDKGPYGLVDDAFGAYKWQLFNASNPIGLAVHELTDPSDVAAKGTIGFQVVVPAQDAQDAVRYFRYGMDHFFENPQRYFITEGPIIDGWAIFNKDIGLPPCNRDHWRAVMGASAGDSNSTIREALVYDRGTVFRRWTPNRSSFSELVDGEHGQQHYWMMVVTDSQGRRAISPHLRTVARGYYTRCGDRQNWFGAAGSYTGIWPSGTHGIRYIDPQFPAGAETEVFGGQHPLATKMSLPFAGNAMTFTDYTIDQRYIRAVSYGMDAWRIENTEPSRTYEAFARVGKWHDIATGMGPVGGPMGTLTTVETTFKSRLAIKPPQPVFPVINLCPKGASFIYTKDGQTVTGAVGAAGTVLDLPAGASVGDYLLLAPMSVSPRGEIGWPADTNKEVAAGTVWKTAYAYMPQTNGWRESLGASGPTPWRLALKQGKLAGVLGMVNLTAEDGGVSGDLKAGGPLKALPVRISGLNDLWPAAVWSAKGLAYSMWSGLVAPDVFPGTTSGKPFLAHIGVQDGTGYATLDNSSDGTFYAGNTLMASDPALALAYTIWTAKAAGIEVNNPTDKPIKARVWSPKAIPGKFRVETTVEVPAGSSIRIMLPKTRAG
jgi:hypothetical protein